MGFGKRDRLLFVTGMAAVAALTVTGELVGSGPVAAESYGCEGDVQQVVSLFNDADAGHSTPDAAARQGMSVVHNTSGLGGLIDLDGVVEQSADAVRYGISASGGDGLVGNLLVSRLGEDRWMPQGAVICPVELGFPAPALPGEADK